MQMGAWTLLLAIGLCIPSTLSMVVISKSTRACSEDPLVKREDRADVIVTGLVDKVVREPKKAMYKCEVKVVRVFKGAETLHNGITPVLQEDKIMVSGFGDPNICSNTVLEGDTKILLMGVDGKGHLSLNSSLLTITYNNLEVVEGAVHDLPVITKPPVEEGACDRILCTFGAYCQEMEDGAPKCICPDNCEGMTAPVCGTDRVTYQSECHMKVAACEAKQLVTVLNQGECVDPCETMACGYGEICQIIGLGAECVCITDCDEVYEPVCGSNGRNYDNKCTMMMTGCKNKKNITAVLDGLCDPCKGVEHEEGTVCRLDENRNPMVECTERCSDEYSPVCGSDGMMYNNTCQMEHAACVMNMEITEVPMDGCATDGPCTEEPCEYGHCSLSTSLEVTCVCPSECPATYSPVCANDGVTYGSMCEMERTACLNGENLMALYHKQCDEDIDPCSKMECSFGAMCTQVNGIAECTCEMACSEEEMDLVCGSDRVTYSNPCEVRRAICLQQTEIEITSMGRCDLCEDHVCDFGGYCVMEGEEVTCQCAEFCNANYRPVCGSDAVTYSNICNLRSKACLLSEDITVVSEGPCDLCLNVNCTHGSRCKNGICKCKGSCPFVYDPVCASDGQTYDNECKMNLTMCRQKVDLTVAYEGECEEESGSGELSGDGEDGSTVSYSNFTAVEFSRCDETTCGFGGVCVPDGMGMKCSCNMSCPAIRMAVCGSDGVTYGNKCQLKKASCEQQKPIVMELGTCEDVEQEPCDGETPLMDSESMEEIKCTEESGGDECPSGSYCHIHSQGSFAVCCPEEMTITPEVTCEDSEYGCCPDGETPAAGESYEGCEDRECDCNDYGAYDKECDANGQCSCRPGVIGELCNSCSPGYWNFRGIVEGNEGCEPCNCNVGGSLRDDCDQNHGSCVCKNGVTGLKCEKCPAGQKMGAMGCERDNASMPLTCDERMCDFGADCVDVNDTSICVCPSDCPGSGEPVCGSDDQTYSTECQLRVISCRSEKVIYVKNTGVCETSITEPMMVPEDCEESQYGCCPDGVTEAMGENLEGCAESTTIFPMVDSTEMPSNTTVEVMACASSPCKHGGTCMESDVAPGFICHCPLGKGGPACMKTVHFEYPSFSGNSYIAYETIRGSFLSVSMIMEFQVTASSDGLLLYNGQEDDGSGDFIALVLVDNHVELRFDLGSKEVVVVRSNVMIEKDTWYRVVASRKKRKGKVSVDGEPFVSASASSGSSGLHLATEMFLGNVAEHRDRVFSRTGISGGFSGCMRHLEVNNEEYSLKYPEDMGDMLFGADIANCGLDPCEDHGCLNNATCVPGEGDRYTCECVGSFMGTFCGDSVGPDQCLGNMCHSGSTCVAEPEGSYRCDCPTGFKGDRCDQLIEPEMSGPFIPAFGGNSFVELPGMKMSSQHKIEVEFYSSEPNGMIFYQGQKTDGNGDFISLNLVEGFLEFRYDLGSGPAELRSYEELNLNEWISVVAIRDGRDGSLEIVEVEKIEGTSKENETELEEGDLSQLNLNLNFFVGGVPEFSELSRKAAITDGLTGAVRKIVLNGEEIVDLSESAIREVNIDEFIPDVCSTHPCMEGFLCEAETGDCVCPEHLVQDGDKCVSGEMTMATGLMTAMDDVATDTDEVDMATDAGMDMMTEDAVGMVTEEEKEMMTGEDLVTEAEEDDETEPMMAVSEMAKTPHKMTESVGMDYTDVDEMETPEMVTHADGMAPQATTPKRMVVSEGGMPTKSEMTPPAMEEISPGMSSMTTMMMIEEEENTDMETEEGTTPMMMMKTSKLMSTLHKMSQMMDTEKPMDMVTSPNMETAKMTPKGMTPTASQMQPTSMRSEQSQDASPAAATTMKKGTTPLQTMTKSAMGTRSFPPPPPMTTTAPPRTSTMADTGMATTKRMTTAKMETTKATTAGRMATTQASSSARMTTAKSSSTDGMTTKATTSTATSVPSTQRSAMSSSIETPDIDSPVSFTGSESYMYNNMITKVVRAQSNNVFSLVFRTTEENGLIMWNGGSDFIGLAVIDGYVMFTYQLGSGTLKMQSSVYVADGNYHRIFASRHIRDGTLQVDDEAPVLDVSKPGASQLNTNGLVYVGGASNIPDKKLPGGFEVNFVGCIGDIYIDEQQLHLFYDAQGDQPEQFCSSSR